jgi:predicted KAP-like P-loop ATPase
VSTVYNKTEILKGLRIWDDEPFSDYISDNISNNIIALDSKSSIKPFFDFDFHASQLVKILSMEEIPSPFSIGIDGEWGSGKSNLIKMIEKGFAQKIKKKENWATIYFNAW